MNYNGSSETVSRGIRIKVEPEYVPEQSSPDQSKFLFAYKVTITNESNSWAKLLTRHWVIINADGDEEVVDGPGVVGSAQRLAARINGRRIGHRCDEREGDAEIVVVAGLERRERGIIGARQPGQHRLPECRPPAGAIGDRGEPRKIGFALRRLDADPTAAAAQAISRSGAVHCAGHFPPIIARVNCP